ncbi:spermidine/putrescine transport system permease protein [Ketogulonicigenium robustum]|uniref:Spermidine/putrescine transport system permease protein n=1 Tax=Ketogulonicigenium robustum TaxID=92947 RepID=A0A1W6P017_9RHOB|nr:ABC transporter permease [Ketogulonicigenium robustum]ARO14751.1 spermidine/putrescine transport system permease protein [Ketogulonicigenium robustum]
MKSWGLKTYAVLYLIFLYAPIALLPLFAFNSGTIIAFPLQGFSTRWFEALWDNRVLHVAVKNSLFVAMMSAIFSTVLGMAAARAGTLYRFPFKAGIMGLIMAPLVLPEIIMAVALLVVSVQILQLTLNVWILIAAHTLITMPFTIAILNGAFANIDPSLEEAALDLGETEWSAFVRVTLPLITPGIVSSLLISFTISLDEYIIASFLTGSSPTMPVYIWGLTRKIDQLPVVMPLGTILVGLSILLLVIAEFFRRRGLARAGVKDRGGFL